MCVRVLLCSHYRAMRSAFQMNITVFACTRQSDFSDNGAEHDVGRKAENVKEFTMSACNTYTDNAIVTAPGDRRIFSRHAHTLHRAKANSKIATFQRPSRELLRELSVAQNAEKERNVVSIGRLCK